MYIVPCTYTTNATHTQCTQTYNTYTTNTPTLFHTHPKIYHSLNTQHTNTQTHIYHTHWTYQKHPIQHINVLHTTHISTHSKHRDLYHIHIRHTTILRNTPNSPQSSKVYCENIRTLHKKHTHDIYTTHNGKYKHFMRKIYHIHLPHTINTQHKQYCHTIHISHTPTIYHSQSTQGKHMHKTPMTHVHDAHTEKIQATPQPTQQITHTLVTQTSENKHNIHATENVCTHHTHTHTMNQKQSTHRRHIHCTITKPATKHSSHTDTTDTPHLFHTDTMQTPCIFNTHTEDTCTKHHIATLFIYTTHVSHTCTAHAHIKLLQCTHYDMSQRIFKKTS